MLHTIYIQLLDEGTAVWRPVSAERLPDGRYLLPSSKQEDEEWAYPPGSIVECAERTFGDGTKALVALRPA